MGQSSFHQAEVMMLVATAVVAGRLCVGCVVMVILATRARTSAVGIRVVNV